ncbi:MAG: 3-carboxy-cis,cis-muconate cycloisomerase [Betaproteobacteria bacterium]|nr:3-carboxy-cis,cis-muconate cycloisomerase [Betaproteobacteria bacterium]
MVNTSILPERHSESFGGEPYAHRLLRQMLSVEAALARAQGQLGLIAPKSAEIIPQVCEALSQQPACLDPDQLETDSLLAGNIAIPFVKKLTAQVAQADAEAAKHVHFGATSQDILDTAAVLVWQQDLIRCEGLLRVLMQHVASLARAHRDTPMIGRTWMQHALPIPFGLKAAGWLDALMRHAQRLEAVREETRVLQFGGATGSLASLGKDGTKVSRLLAQILGLNEPNLPWFGHRDRVFSLASVLVGLTGSLGKIAKDVSLMAQTEVAELREGAAPGKGGSSTMPHKRNPVHCAAILTQATFLPGLLGVLASALPQEHERALGGWQAEWQAMPEILQGTESALQQSVALLAGLEVRSQTMRANVDLSQGLVMAESVAFGLAPQIGKIAAHALLERLSRQATDQGQTLEEALLQDAEASRLATPEQFAAWLSPLAYLGVSTDFVDRVLDAYDRMG